MTNDKIEKTEILTNDDISFLRSSPQFEKLIKHLEDDLTKAREEVDSISSAGLPALQGRIFTLKTIIKLFGDIYYE